MKTSKKPKKIKVVFTTASELYDRLLNIYKTENDKLTKAKKKRINVQNRPEKFPANIVFMKTSCKNFSQTSSRRLAKTSSRRLAKMYSRRFSRRIIRLNCLPSTRICLGYTSERFMVSLENLQV